MKRTLVRADRRGQKVYFSVTFAIAGASYPEGFNACNQADQPIPHDAVTMTIQLFPAPFNCPGVPTRGTATIVLS